MLKLQLVGNIGLVKRSWFVSLTNIAVATSNDENTMQPKCIFMLGSCDIIAIGQILMVLFSWYGCHHTYHLLLLDANLITGARPGDNFAWPCH